MRYGHTLPDEPRVLERLNKLFPGRDFEAVTDTPITTDIIHQTRAGSRAHH